MTPFKTAAACGALLTAMPASAQHQGHDMGNMAMPAPAPAPAPSPAPAEHQGHDMSGMAMPAGEAAQPHAMTGALGAYRAAREASGTAWQPDSSGHGGVHLMAGDWML